MSSSDEDPPPPPPRDPLLDDPEFAELVNPVPKPEPEPEFAEPIEDPVESLPVAKVIRPTAEPVPTVKPITVPSKLAPNVTMPVPVETEPPRPQWFAACGVIGCIGVLFIAAFATLIYIAITLLSNLGDKITDTRPSTKPNTAAKVARGPILPTQLAKDTEVPLAGRVDAIGRGGDGRFLILRMPRQREIHVFDVNQLAIVHTFPIREEGALFAAGAEKLFICEPLDGRLHRYDLFTGEKEADKEIPKKSVARVRGMTMGAGSAGPLYIATAGPTQRLKIVQFDGGSLDPTKTDEFAFTIDPRQNVVMNASDTGLVLAASCTEGAVGLWFGTKPRSQLLTPEQGAKPTWAAPSLDGQFFYSPCGVYDSAGRAFNGTRSGFYCFPASQGTEWYLSLDEKNDLVSGTPRVHPAGVKSLARGKDLANAELTDWFPLNELRANEPTAADRVHYWPGAGLAAVLPRTPASEPAKMLLFRQPNAAKN